MGHLPNTIIAAVLRTLMLILPLSAIGVYTACTFPSGLQGNWKRYDNKEFVITSNKVTGLKYTYRHGITIDEFCCTLQSNGMYILSSDFMVDGSVPSRFYMCWSVDKASAGLYFLKEMTSNHGARGILPDGPGVIKRKVDPINVRQICNLDDDQVLPIALINPNKPVVAVTCPSIMHATFTPGSGCSGGGVIDVCSDRKNLNLTSCLDNDGLFSCIGSTKRGIHTFISVYHSPFISCLRVVKDGSKLTVVYFKEKDCSQTGEVAFVKNKTLDIKAKCPPSEESSNIGIIVAVVSALLLLAVVAYYLKRKMCPPKVHDEEGSTKKELDDGMASGTKSGTTDPAPNTNERDVSVASGTKSATTEQAPNGSLKNV